MADPLVDEQGDGDRIRAALVFAATVGFVSFRIWSLGLGGIDPEEVVRRCSGDEGFED